MKHINKKLVLSMMTQIFALVFTAQTYGTCYNWNVNGDPHDGSISHPVNSGVYLCGADVQFMCSRASDNDERCPKDGGSWETVADSMSSNHPRWTATAGSFKNGDNRGTIVHWIAPDSETSNITVRMYEDDLPNAIGECDSGTRDDEPEAPATDYLRVTKTGIQVIIPEVGTVDYGGGNHAISDVTTPEYLWAVRNEPASWTFLSDATATVTFWDSQNLSQSAIDVTVRADTSGDYFNIGDWGNNAGNTFGTSWPTSGIECVSEMTINEKIEYRVYSAQWKYKCPYGSNNWINTTNQTPCRLAVVYGAPTGSCNYTKDNIYNAISKASGETTEAAIASKANTTVGRNLYEGCICGDFSWNQTNFDAAMGTYPPPPPPPENERGMCCCRAEGLDCVLNVLGIGPYTNIYCNEMPEEEWATSDHSCEGWCTSHGPVIRMFWAGFWNNWEGAVRSGDTGTTAYAPGGGPFEDDHDGIADNWTYYWSYDDGQYDRCTGACEIEIDDCSAHSAYWDRF